MIEPEPRKFFEHDAFISYAHLDNKHGAVRALHAQLREFLLHRLHWEPSVWLDELSLSKNVDFDPQIRDGLRRAAVLIPVISGTVESRKWCRDELSWFLTGADLEHVSVRRVYPAFLPTTDVEQLPRWIKNDYDLFRFEIDPERQELFAKQDLDAHRPYWDQLYGWMSAVAVGIVAAHTAWAHWQDARAGRRIEE